MPSYDEFLIEYFKQSQERMRHTSDVELRLLQFLLLFYPIIGVAVVTLYNSPIDRTIFSFISFGAAVFLLLITWRIDVKIRAEHNTYREIGQAVKKVLRYYKLSEQGAYISGERIIPEEEVTLDQNKGYGAGKGYRRTLCIVWSMASAMFILTILLGVLTYI